MIGSDDGTRFSLIDRIRMGIGTAHAHLLNTATGGSYNRHIQIVDDENIAGLRYHFSVVQDPQTDRIGWFTWQI